MTLPLLPAMSVRFLRRAGLRLTFASAAALAIFASGPLSVAVPWSVQPAHAEDPPPPPPPDGEADAGADDGGDAADAGEIDPLNPGEAVVTRFSHSIEEQDDEGRPVDVIDINGVSASIIDIRSPGEPPSGQHWIDEPQRMLLSAGEVGQVFGVALGGTENDSPDIFLTATAAFGLHRTSIGPDSTDWMSGMWGPDAGPGSIWRISVDNGYEAEKFADVTLDGRANTGAALGNIAYDSVHDRLFVSDLETGMIHSIDASSGDDLGHYDHGVDGRVDFTDAATGEAMALDPVAFDPDTAAQTDSCPTDFSKSPECWNIADFRRRIWGLNVHRDADDNVRLYYSVWGSDAFGNTDWAEAGDDRRNAVWSIAIDEDGLFDTETVRREFFMPGFWPSTPDLGDKAGNSNAVSDITFPDCGPQDVMLVSERGGMRNLGLDKEEAFSRPYESRVIRYERGNDNIWRAKGRYEVGFRDRTIDLGAPEVFANAAGGAAFGYGLGDDGSIDTSAPSQSVWMTGDGLCSPNGPCTSMATGEHSDSSEVHGIQGSPADASVEVDAPANPDALDQSYMVDTDINIDEGGEAIESELTRNDATQIGDVAIYQVCEGVAPLPDIGETDEAGIVPLPPVEEPPEDWPVHTLKQSHEKWASTGHRIKRSWHRREGSWHDVDRSWHWKRQSYHSRNKSWHWRNGSWHSKAQSWHWKGHSIHSKRYSWHFRDRSWHLKTRTYHNKTRTWGGGHQKGKTYHFKTKSWGNHFKGRTWGGHNKGKTFHKKGQTWGDGGKHIKGKTFHKKGQTWGDGGKHIKGKTFHKKGQTWGDGGKHIKGKTFHKKGQTWGDGGKHIKGKTFHKKGQTWGDGGKHTKGKTFHKKGQTWGDGGKHKKRDSQNDGGGKGKHVKGKTFHQKGKTWGDAGKHKKRDSQNDGGGKGKHVKGKTFHQKGKTWGDTGKHKKRDSQNDGGGKGKHVKGKTFHQKGKTWGDTGKHKKKASQNDGGGKGKHVKGKTFHQKGKTWGDTGKHKKKASQNDGGNGKHKKKASQNDGGGKDKHVKGKSFHQKGKTWGDTGKHKKKASQQQGGGDQPPKHKKKASQQQGGGDQPPKHKKKASQQQQGGGDQPPKHKKKASQQQQGGGQQGGGDQPPKHRKKASQQQQGGGQQGGGDQPPKHKKKLSQQQQGGGDQPPKHKKKLSLQQQESQ